MQAGRNVDFVMEGGTYLAVLLSILEQRLVRAWEECKRHGRQPRENVACRRRVLSCVCACAPVSVTSQGMLEAAACGQRAQWGGPFCKRVPNWPLGSSRGTLLDPTKSCAMLTIVAFKLTSPWWYALTCAT